MEIIEVSYEEYGRIIEHPPFVFNSAEFNNLNSKKCDSVHYLLFKDVHYRLGIIGGIKNGQFLSPFSAPYGGFSFMSKDLRLTYIDEAIDLLINWVKKHNFSGIYITLSSRTNDESYVPKFINSLFRKSFNIDKIDLNYSFNLDKFDDQYLKLIDAAARKALKKSFINQLEFKYCESFNEKRIAFDLIKKHKSEHNYPLHLAFDGIIETSNIVVCDFFLVKDINSLPIASAIVYHVTKENVQLIYWGDLLEKRYLRVMNFLSYKIFEYYKVQGKKFVDVGPASQDSIPDFGLCVFKESIGCEIASKFSFSISFSNS